MDLAAVRPRARGDGSMWVFDGEEWIDDEDGDSLQRKERITPPVIPIDAFLPELQVQIVTPTQRPVPPPPM